MNNSDKPAFPPPIASANDSIYNVADQTGGELIGITKREYFAAMAMQGILASRELQIALYKDIQINPGCTNKNCIAFHAVKEADELLKQLEAEDPDELPRQ